GRWNRPECAESPAHAHEEWCMDFALSATNGRNRTLWRAYGELDIATTGRLEQALFESLREGPVELDLSAVTFCDSTAVHCLLRAAELARRTSNVFVIVRSSPEVVRVLELSGLLHVLPVAAMTTGA